MKKNIDTMLSLILAMLCLSSCASSTVQKNSDDTPDVSGSDSTETEESGYLDDLGKYDFGGVEFYIDASPMSKSSFYNSYVGVEKTDGDIHNDAVYKRNRDCEERFNFVLKQTNSDD